MTEQDSIGVDRRHVLGLGAAAGATAVLGGVLTTGEPAQAGGPGPLCAPAGLKGRALLPGRPGYDAAVAGFNLVQTPAPGLVIAAENARDVQLAVRLAAQRRAPIAVLATGHQPSVPIGRDAILVSTKNMREVTVDARRRTARVEAGALWTHVLDRSLPQGLTGLNGSTPTVGVVGYTLGGGLSPTLGRRYGYAADHVRSIDLVTADGRLRTVTGANDPELFFGVRGGKSNFGLVTGIEFDLFPVSTFYGGAIIFDGKDAQRLLHAYRRWVRTVPEAMSSSVALMNIPDDPSSPPPLRGKAIVSLRICWTGRQDTGEALVRPLRAIATPLLDMVTQQPYSAFPAIHSDPAGPVPAYERTALLSELTGDAVEALVAAAGPGAPYPITMVEVRHLGGALARQPRHASAVAHRDAGFTLFGAGVTGPAEVPALRAALDRVVRLMRPWSTGGSYLNFMSVDEASTRAVSHAYPDHVYRRLRRLKRRVDPYNLFRLNHNIPPA
ncbi:FAD-binding oxidoreductase [Actinoplanes sichuanensis]|uniref:FAD-binding oxidoreductase n=1 Tax=Actinoplanes sichuanensis TaxID=512349 RepID=A0ABW4A3I5_9ACTN|nr:FAD-dependent oxidoreductase [Actinoplanes sichuanensis]BEL05836.1 FAD-binding oxidoreductase [Actinoplanes sichuanensis]